MNISAIITSIMALLSACNRPVAVIAADYLAGTVDRPTALAKLAALPLPTRGTNDHGMKFYPYYMNDARDALAYLLADPPDLGIAERRVDSMVTTYSSVHGTRPLSERLGQDVLDPSAFAQRYWASALAERAETQPA